jgi:hypothetical protein
MFASYIITNLEKIGYEFPFPFQSTIIGLAELSANSLDFDVLKKACHSTIILAYEGENVI